MLEMGLTESRGGKWKELKMKMKQHGGWTFWPEQRPCNISLAHDFRTGAGNFLGATPSSHCGSLGMILGVGLQRIPDL